MITRKAWGAKSLTAYAWNIPLTKRTGIVIHHTVTPTGGDIASVETILRQIDDEHRAKGWGGIGYNIAVDHLGNIYEARGMNVMGCHTANANTANFGIAYIGDGRTDVSAVTVSAIKTAIASCNRATGKTLTVRGHRDLFSTECPGARLYAHIKSGKFA